MDWVAYVQGLSHGLCGVCTRIELRSVWRIYKDFDMCIVWHVITRPLHVRKKSLELTPCPSAAVGGGEGFSSV